MLRLLDQTGLRAPLEEFVRTKPVLGTCAGAILLARESDGLPREPLGALDATVLRNAYGRQVFSFVDDVDVRPLGGAFKGVFIRAPRFARIGDGVEVIATRAGETVGVRQGRIVAIAFHPEIAGDLRFHRWFLASVAGLALAVPDSAGVSEAT
jgi:5'-phosphate synthase pdxT subunit